MQSISVKRKSPFSSAEVNKTLYELLGRKNGVMYGMSVHPGTEDWRFSIDSGSLYIEGCRITETENLTDRLQRPPAPTQTSTKMDATLGPWSPCLHAPFNSSIRSLTRSRLPRRLFLTGNTGFDRPVFEGGLNCVDNNCVYRQQHAL